MPGVVVYPIEMYNHVESLVNLNRQISKIVPVMQEVLVSLTTVTTTTTYYCRNNLLYINQEDASTHVCMHNTHVA